MALQVNSNTHLKEQVTAILQLFQKSEKESTLPKLLHEGTITLIRKPEREMARKL